jgi:ABC-2 type transport system ATP-binding protein
MDPFPASAITISNLTKSYKAGFLNRQVRPALVGLDLDVQRGEIFGYLGPNGSGKTTTLKILMGIVHPDSGTARVLGSPLEDREWRGRIGYLPEHPYFYDYLTPAEYLDYVGRLFGLAASTRRERARDLLMRVGLSAGADVPLRRFSKGMMQRIGIAQALMNDPELVFLDEPMSGLDPIGRRMVRDIILALKEQGKTVFFSTHILPDAETLCDRVALLRAGRLLKVGRLDEMLSQEAPQVEVLVTGGSLDGLPAEVQRQAIGERWRLEVPETGLVPLLNAVTVGGSRILSVQPIRQSLEDYFLQQMGLPPGGQGAKAQGQWELQD